MALFRVAKYGTKGFSRATFNPQLLKVVDNLSDVYVHWTSLDASATSNTSNVLELFWGIEQLVIEALP